MKHYTTSFILRTTSNKRYRATVKPFGRNVARIEIHKKAPPSYGAPFAHRLSC